MRDLSVVDPTERRELDALGEVAARRPDAAVCENGGANDFPGAARLLGLDQIPMAFELVADSLLRTRRMAVPVERHRLSANRAQTACVRRVVTHRRLRRYAPHMIDVSLALRRPCGCRSNAAARLHNRFAHVASPERVPRQLGMRSAVALNPPGVPRP